MTKVEVEDHQGLTVTHDICEGEPSYVVVKGCKCILTPIWLSPDEARELVKALKKHIKKAEGK